MQDNNEHQVKIESTLDSLIEGCQLIGFDWRYIYVNTAVVKQSKCASRDELLGATMMDKFPGIEKTEMFAALETCMKSRISKSMLNKFTFPDKSEGWYELRIAPVPSGIFIISLDVTEREKAEAARNNYVKSLEKLLFFTSHKLRQPVCNILGLVEVLEVTEVDDEEYKSTKSYIKRAATVLDGHTRELTKFLTDKKIWFGDLMDQK